MCCWFCSCCLNLPGGGGWGVRRIRRSDGDGDGREGGSAGREGIGVIRGSDQADRGVSIAGRFAAVGECGGVRLRKGEWIRVDNAEEGNTAHIQEDLQASELWREYYGLLGEGTAEEVDRS